MPEKFNYEIGGKTYIQKPLVLGQIRQMINLLQGIVIPGNTDAIGLITLLGDKLPIAIAIVLIPEDVDLKNKDIRALADEIEFEISPELSMQVIEDFFVLTPIVSLLERLKGMANKIGEKIVETSLRKSAPSSVEEISQKETASFGESH